MRSTPPSVRRPLITAMVLQYAVGGAFFPFITLLLRDRGWSVAEISRVFTLGSAALLISPFLWGLLADRWVPLNRVFGLMNGLAALALLGFAQQTDLLGITITYVGCIACLQPTLMLVNALSFRHLPNPQEQFAILRAWGSIGWILPSLPVFAWLLWRPEGNFEFTIPLTIAGAVAMTAASFSLPATPPGGSRRRAAGATPPPLGYWTALHRLTRNPNFLVLLAAYFLVAASFAIATFYSAPRLRDLGMPRAWIGIVQSFGILAEVLLFRWRGHVVNRLGHLGTILAGCGALALRQFLFATSNDLWVLAASYLLLGITVVLFHIGVSLLVETIARTEVKATAQTLLVLCSSGLGPMFANGMVGWLAPGLHPSLHGVFLFSGTLALLAGVLVLARGRRLVEKN